MADAGKKKVAIAGIASILLVACVVGAAVTLTKKNGNDSSSGGQVSTSSKSVQSMCQPTQYKEACEKSLGSAKNTSDPKELIKASFDSTVTALGEAIKNSAPFKDAENDPRTKDALKVCEEVLDRSVEEIKRSYRVLDTSDFNKLIKDSVYDLRSWLSASSTFEVTCIDAFANTTGDAGEKMKNLLKSSHEFTSNALDIVSSFEEQVADLKSVGITNRKLLTVEAGNRKLLQVAPLKPNVVVAQDGSGQHKSINDALKTVPQDNAQPYVIFIKAGIYNENVQVTTRMKNVVFIGEGPTKTKITSNRNFFDGIPVYSSATVAINGEGFVAKDIGIENTAGPTKHEAVALRVSAEMAVFQNCQIDGFQSTLMAHVGRQFYRDCTISGSIDIIFGDATAVYQNCKLIARKTPDSKSVYFTAQARTQPSGAGAFIIQNCTFSGEPAFVNQQNNAAFLGRIQKMYSRTIVMQSQIDGIIDPEGWSGFGGNLYLDTIYYVEYQNRGPGANTDSRVDWKNLIKNPAEDVVAKFTPGAVLRNDEWVKKSGAPYEAGLMKV